MRTKGQNFEQSVRDVARALWGLRDGEGASEFINGDEIDCVCRTEDVTHLIESTTDMRMDKFRRQVNKLILAKSYLEKRGETVRLWSVTNNEPTTAQRTTARGHGITALSFKAFKTRLLDSQQYLQARWHYRFGSAADPDSGSTNVAEDEYIRLPLNDINAEKSYSIREICDLLYDGQTIILVGPFGAGKSLTVREIFNRIRRDFYNERTDRTPIALNLREHWGQSRVDEILRRHSDQVGFDHANQLVRAWNAGQLIPLLDGFDELASPVMAMTKNAITNSRLQAIGVIRSFLDNMPYPGILIAGRDHYFDSNEEASKLMRLPEGSIFIEVGEFSEEQAVSYLQKKKVLHELPAWLPRKPLLLGYLASADLLGEVVGIEGDGGAALAWDTFIEKICHREAALNPDAIDSIAFRSLLEDLATRVRTRPGGSGPLLDSDLASAYKKVTGYDALEAALILLQRLPGLTARDQEVGARSFIDDEMMEALQGGSVARFIQNPYQNICTHALQHPLSEFGCTVANHLCRKWGVKNAGYSIAAQEAKNRWNSPTLALDTIFVGAANADDEPIDANHLEIADGFADVIDMEERPVKGLTLTDCMINLVRYDDRQSEITFRNCSIVRVEGIGGSRALPACLSDCDVDLFDDRQTNAAIIRSNLSEPLKVLLVMIRKLFLQRGSGRAETALHRGVNDGLQPYVDSVRDLLESEGVIYSHSAGGQKIWHGSRSNRGRMLRILESAESSGDPLVQKVAGLVK